VTIPLAVAWAALGVWLGRRQERQAQPDAHADCGRRSIPRDIAALKHFMSAFT
jgi:hypothetical protein